MQDGGHQCGPPASSADSAHGARASRPQAARSRTWFSILVHSSLYMSFISGLSSTQCMSACMHSSHIATFASDARSRACSSATCCRSAVTSEAEGTSPVMLLLAAPLSFIGHTAGEPWTDMIGVLGVGELTEGEPSPPASRAGDCDSITARSAPTCPRRSHGDVGLCVLCWASPSDNKFSVSLHACVGGAGVSSPHIVHTGTGTDRYRLRTPVGPSGDPGARDSRTPLA